MFNRSAYSFTKFLNVFESRGTAFVAPDAEGASGAMNTDNTDTGWNLVSG
ncbi:hypothetical protein BX285_1521 [Streptomyces sp. 1114.5]|nr:MULTISPECIES: hypothetical protein [unclassified Streptomyces]RKT17157.1 hypothetical protein BX285_1521 [Streptomyces sp. 1114.5]SOB83366.1 hypothetical protein SAMN06272789_3570 [Streptomyces sp. 1331.2]